jgi:hypothetical protein
MTLVGRIWWRRDGWTRTQNLAQLPTPTLLYTTLQIQFYFREEEREKGRREFSIPHLLSHVSLTKSLTFSKLFIRIAFLNYENHRRRRRVNGSQWRKKFVK